jgi:hypothetical protein
MELKIKVCYFRYFWLVTMSITPLVQELSLILFLYPTNLLLDTRDAMDSKILNYSIYEINPFWISWGWFMISNIKNGQFHTNIIENRKPCFKQFNYFNYWWDFFDEVFQRKNCQSTCQFETNFKSKFPESNKSHRLANKTSRIWLCDFKSLHFKFCQEWYENPISKMSILVAFYLLSIKIYAKKIR